MYYCSVLLVTEKVLMYLIYTLDLIIGMYKMNCIVCIIHIYITENLVTQMLRQGLILGVQGLLLYIGLRRRILKHVPVRYGRLLSFLPFQSLLYFLLLVLQD